MENFGSRGESALETCLSELEQCDVAVTLAYGDEDWSRPSDRQANVEWLATAE